MENDDKLIDEFIAQDLKKDVTQEETVNESVEKQLGQMGWLYETVENKILKDNICFKCKHIFHLEKDNPHIVEATQTEKGAVSFICLCEKCFKKIEKEQIKKQKEGEQKKNGTRKTE